MSSPFVTQHFKTYEYPAPLDPDDHKGESDGRISDAMKINPEELDAGHWVKFRIPASRKDVDMVADLTASRLVAGTNGDGAQFQQRIHHGNRGVFELLVDSWSFDAMPSGEMYDKLTTWAGDWIIACMAEVTSLGTKRDWAEKNEGSSTTPDSSPPESPVSQPVASE